MEYPPNSSSIWYVSSENNEKSFVEKNWISEKKDLAIRPPVCREIWFKKKSWRKICWVLTQKFVKTDCVLSTFCLLCWSSLNYRISSYRFRPLNSFLTFMYCDLWPYVLCPLDFQVQKRIVSAETIWENTVVYVPFGQSNMHNTFDICHRLAKKTNVPLNT